VIVGLSVAAALLALDSQNVAARFRRPVAPESESSDDYTIVVPLFGDPSYFRNRAELAPYKDNVLLAIDVRRRSMRRFANRLEEEGWRVCRCRPRTPSPPSLVLRALRDVTTEYVIRLDGDSRPVGDLGRAIAGAARARSDLCSVTVLPSRRITAAEHLQSVEYACAMRGRRLRPWQTSGACIVGRVEVLETLLRLHSRWFAGEDIETGILARQLRLRIHHLDLKVQTDVPSTFRGLFAQRRSWWAGSFRITWVNVDWALHAPVTLAYSAGFVWLGFVAKSVGLLTAVEAVPLIALVYTAITLISNWEVRDRWMVVYPYYSLLQATVMPLLGLARYLTMARAHGNLGRLHAPQRRLLWT
jgi:cellulose synthase/poly-beta-1,6-N-acetylglucosamine synthase-like glycosyltransferase